MRRKMVASFTISNFIYQMSMFSLLLLLPNSVMVRVILRSGEMTWTSTLVGCIMIAGLAVAWDSTPDVGHFHIVLFISYWCTHWYNLYKFCKWIEYFHKYSEKVKKRDK